MANAKLVAPPDPATVADAAVEAAKDRSKALKAKGSKRTPAETSELVDLLEARLTALEARS